MSVQTVVLMEYNNLSTEFYSTELIRKVREHERFKYIHDDTIHRKLRLLRKEGKLNYKVIDRKKSQYRKVLSDGAAS